MQLKRKAKLPTVIEISNAATKNLFLKSFFREVKYNIVWTILTLSLPVTTFVVYSLGLLMFVDSLYCKQYELPLEQSDHGPYFDKVLIFFHSLVLWKYLVPTEIRILLKPVLGGMRIVALSITPYEQTQ